MNVKNREKIEVQLQHISVLTTRLEMQSKTAGILEVISLIEITKTHASQQVHFVGKSNLFS